ncbi:crossover junction endodeoxyribonuclease RuvC [Magnetococcales bacterium HHB-1]
MRILGIDPGSCVTGWGILDGQQNSMQHIAHGTIRLPKTLTLPERLGKIFLTLKALIETHAPDALAIEEVFVAHNVQSALKLGQARGAAITAASSVGLSVAEYTALQVKKAVTGYGRADKNQIRDMICMLCSLSKAPAQDASDALAIALCHHHHICWLPDKKSPIVIPRLGGRRRQIHKKSGNDQFFQRITL